MLIMVIVTTDVPFLKKSINEEVREGLTEVVTFE